MPAFSVGVDVSDHRAIALAVDVRSGRIAGSARAPDAQAAYDKAIQSPEISDDQIIGVGLAGSVGAISTRHLVIRAPSSAHACLLGSGVASPSTMVLVLDDRSCSLLINSRAEAHPPGVQVAIDPQLPGYFSYAFAPIGLPMDGRPNIEQFAFNVRRACESLRGAGVQVRRFVATRVPPKSEELMQVLADVLNAKIKIAASDQPAALGAAIFAAIAAGAERSGHASMSQTVHAMAHQRRDLIYRPDVRTRDRYDEPFSQTF